MSNLNTKLVESLDLLNHVLAFIFVALSIYRFFDIVGDNFFGALLESITVLGVGILTCGYIALMININNLLVEIRNQGK